MDNGIKIVMFPVQLAAVMSDETVTEGQTFTNRIWGGVGFLGGVLELAGASALCMVPEPTGITKTGCVIVGVYSIDSLSASAYQIYTGRNTTSMTARAASGIASELGADDDTAKNIGIAVDIAIPFTVAGAAKVASVKMGQVKLIRHEAIKGIRGGGHTIKKHIGMSEQELLDKVARGKQSGTFTAGKSASSFTSLDIAEKAVSQAIKNNRWKIRRWAKNTSSDGETSYLEVEQSFTSHIGIIISENAEKAQKAYRVRVILSKKSYNGKPYYIVTSYPISG
ncbi:RNase A-like domain-containing protein [Rouxiella sp. Mn2063]|uniref:RNase A-like domain-containing protein n=1 Tax=Rouxiella sp. Mn2063 TaxID=3395262 RepID=UPI003BCFF020